MRNYLAIDIGTTNWKAAVFTQDGTLVGIEKIPAKTHSDGKGRSWYQPHELWTSICSLISQVISKTDVPIEAISVTSFSEAVIGIDKDGNPVGNIIAWFDTRSLLEAEYLKETFGEDHLFSITGLDVNPIFSLPKILWLRAHENKNFEKSICYLQMADFIIQKLSGICVTDYTLASRTLALDVVNNCWSKEILAKVGLPLSIFPEIVSSGTLVGTISRKASLETGLLPSVKVVVGGNDHPCASLAAGVLSGNKLLDSSGTAESFIYISKKHATPLMEFRGQRVCRYLDKDRYALWGGIISSGRTFDWAYELFVSSKQFGIAQDPYDWDYVLDQVVDIKGIEDGLFFYPHLRGAGAPYWNPRISASFIGLRERHTSAVCLKAVLEGLCMQARIIVEMEEKLASTSVESLCVVGGGSRNLQWQAIKANIIGKPIELCKESEATALGAAMLASLGCGAYGSLEEISSMLSKTNVIIEPNEKKHAAYEPFYALFQEGYEQTKFFNEKIFDLTKEN